MTKDGLRYDKMVENALRGVVLQAISLAAEDGLPGGHHFYITFKTLAPGVEIGEQLHMKYPDEMTIVIEHQFWDLTVSEDGFAVTLSFNNRPERLAVPFAAITAFADPSVKFGLQFQEATTGDAPTGKTGAAEEPASRAKRTGPKLVEDQPAASGSETPPGACAAEPAKVAAKKPGEVVTLDTFRKK